KQSMALRSRPRRPARLRRRVHGGLRGARVRRSPDARRAAARAPPARQRLLRDAALRRDAAPGLRAAERAARLPVLHGLGLAPARAALRRRALLGAARQPPAVALPHVEPVALHGAELRRDPALPAAARRRDHADDEALDLRVVPALV